jgi:hypothetical protein
LHRFSVVCEQVLPPLLDVIPEARLNLVIYYLRNEQARTAQRQLRTCS